MGMWFGVTSRRSRILYFALLALGAVLGAAAVAVADDGSAALLAGAVTAALLATFWREVTVLRGMASAEAQTITYQETFESGDTAPGGNPDANAKTVERGRVESWDEETGWGVLSAGLPDGGVFAHFSAVEGEGYRALKPGDAVTFDYTPAAGGPGSQDGCSYIAERVVQLDD